MRPRLPHFALATLLLGATSRIGAQQTETDLAMEVRPLVGVLIATGDRRKEFKDATTAGVEGAYERSSRFHLVVSVAWTHGHAKFGSLNNDLTHVWHYDAGFEVNALRHVDSTWLFRPFVGAGLGLRSYEYTATGMGSSMCNSGYGTAGAELQRHRIALRFEGRDYLSCFQSPITAEKRTVNDIRLSFGIAIHLF